MELPTVSTAYLWFDTEYSTLELGKARLLQVALVITDASLRRVGGPESDINLYLRIDDEVKVSPWIMETMPDLVAQCRSDAAVDVEEADRRLCAAIDRAVVVPLGDDKKKPILAGNSIHSDWYLLLKYFPGMRQRLHYRHLDVTTLKLQWQDYAAGEKFEKDDVRLVKKYFPDLVVNGQSKLHDAYYDCQASIAELAYYRKRLFKRPASAAS
ncbi:MAG TPA: exonuclease domain-containing protein [Kiritimatiellia bacterium]|nr:exonuclease domain-containing protein [Kiritimatiellia bacterium]HMO99087.1 exonuclease domain-containing protein [Kiritimatiellia bacterium]HMP96618.1 exonuclease domain-containing protein [Kiritimatiellia bacterium]